MISRENLLEDQLRELRAVYNILKEDYASCVKSLKKMEKKVEKLEGYKKRNEEAYIYVQVNYRTDEELMNLLRGKN